MGLRRLYKDIKEGVGYIYYTRVFTPRKVRSMREQARIHVIFVITELGMWKTERLYLEMKKHPRFAPVIRVLPYALSKHVGKEVAEYFEKKGYDYEFVAADERLQSSFKADIIFYSKPYSWEYERLHTLQKNKDALFAYVSYGFHNVLSGFVCNQPLHNYCWQYYFENETCAQEVSKLMRNKGRNVRITGIPMMDDFTQPASSYRDLWKKQESRKKRIIWAPHHSVSSENKYLRYSTFLEYAGFMLELAQKYKEQVQFLFKPHPRLLLSLYELWGKERTDAYYAQWDAMENAQMELGQYIDFFMTSDAMIHDCSSFSIEYLYARKPVMFLRRGEEGNQGTGLNSFSKQAYGLHYMADSKQDIEHFIQDVVICGNDEKKEERQAFYAQNLIPTNGCTACQNILEAILGEDGKN